MRFVLACLSLLLVPARFGPVSAHVLLERASPSPGSTVAAPAEIALAFTGAVDPARSGLSVRCDKKAEAGPPRRPADDPKRLLFLLRGAGPGACDVTWHAMAEDGGRTDGHYGFTIGAAPAAPVSKARPQAAEPAPVAVSDAWARATPPRAADGVAYLTLLSRQDDQLVGVSTPSARAATLHDMTMDGEVMRMRPLPDGLALPAGKAVALAPGGLHLMLEGLKAPLKQGGTLALHLEFRKAKAMEVEVPVRAAGTTMREGN